MRQRSTAAWIFTISATTTNPTPTPVFKLPRARPMARARRLNRLRRDRRTAAFTAAAIFSRSGACRDRLILRPSPRLIRWISPKRSIAHRSSQVQNFSSPCRPVRPVGRSIPNGRSMIARSAVETGIWPLKEAIHGEVTHTYVPRRFEPVENYLNRQGASAICSNRSSTRRRLAIFKPR